MITLKYENSKYIPGMVCDICKTPLDSENSIAQWNDNLQLIITCKNCNNNSYPYCVTLSSLMFNLCCNCKFGILKKPKTGWDK